MIKWHLHLSIISAKQIWLPPSFEKYCGSKEHYCRRINLHHKSHRVSVSCISVHPSVIICFNKNLGNNSKKTMSPEQTQSYLLIMAVPNHESKFTFIWSAPNLSNTTRKSFTKVLSYRRNKPKLKSNSSIDTNWPGQYSAVLLILNPSSIFCAPFRICSWLNSSFIIKAKYKHRFNKNRFNFETYLTFSKTNALASWSWAGPVDPIRKRSNPK